MQHQLVKKDATNVVGIQVRTSNQMEMDKTTARIPGLWQRFLRERLMDQIPNRTDTQYIYGVYSDYESEHNAFYSLLVGVEVDKLDDVPGGMTGLTIPDAKYSVFTAKGRMPEALIETWGHIWQYFAEISEYERSYTTDFELHNKHKRDQVDIYIGLK